MKRWLYEQFVRPLRALVPLLLLGVVALSIIIVPVAVVETKVVKASPGWLTDYEYRQAIIINGTSVGVQSDYQIKIVVDNATDASTGSICYLNGHVQADFDDIRFTESDGDTEVDYWAEDVNNGDNVTVWVECASIGEGVTNQTYFYIYYGNTTVSSGSDGAAALVFFDTFPGSSLDGEKWSTKYLEGSSGGSASVADSELTVQQLHQESGTSFIAYTDTTYQYKRLRVKTKFPDFEGILGRNRWGSSGFGCSTAYHEEEAFLGAWEGSASDAREYRSVKAGNPTYTSYTHDPTSYHIYQIDRLNSSSTKYYYDDTFVAEHTTNITTQSLPLKIMARVWTNTYDVRAVVDWIGVMNLCTPEPFVGGWGSQEAETDNPLVTTLGASVVNEDNATLEGNITSTGANATCDSRGFEWSALYTNYTIGDNSYDYVYGTEKMAQTFTTNQTVNMSSARLKVFQNSNTTGPLGVIVEVRSCYDNGTPTETVLRSGTFNGSTVSEDSGVGAWSFMTLGGTYLLSNNTQYALVVYAPNATLGNEIGWRINDYANYTGGQYMRTGSGFGAPGPGYSDAMFEVWGIESWVETTNGWAGGVGTFNHTVDLPYNDVVYNYRAKAHSSYGWGYGESVNFSYNLGPTLDTASPTVGETHARLTGSITSTGAGLADFRGFVWDTASYDPMVEDDAPANGTEYLYNWTEGSAGSYVYDIGSFNHNITGLSRGQRYYVRACAHNNVSWSYGDEVEFWTLPAGPSSLSDTNITSSSATFGWTKGDGAAYTMIRYLTNTYPSTPTEGSQGYFGTANTAVIPNLDGGQHYYFRAWSWTAGAGYSLNTSSHIAVTLVGVTTNSATDVSNTSATLRGTLTSSWDTANDRGFEWGTATGCYTDQWTQAGTYGTGSYTHTNSSLSVSTPYYYRAKANCTQGWSYGDEVSFITTAGASPTVTTNEATSVGCTTALLHGTVTSMGDYSTVQVSFAYGPTIDYGYNTTEQTLTSAGVFDATVSSLLVQQTYYYMAMVRYDTSYGYGARETFVTTGVLNPPTGLSASRGDTTITLSWTKGLGATNTLIRRGTTNYPLSPSSGVQVYLGPGTSVTDTGLDNTMEYYYSAWSEMSGVYSQDYTTVYSSPSGTGVDILDTPDVFYITNVMVFESYQEAHDQLVCFEYQLTYSEGNPVQEASNFFVFELYSGVTMIARGPVRAWGWKPGSIYLSAANSMTWEGTGYVVKLKGIPSQWTILPEKSASIASSSWQSSREDQEQLRQWILSMAKIINPGWVAVTDGEALNDVGCVVFRDAIPGVTTQLEGICGSTLGYIDYERESFDPAYQRMLTRERNLGNETNNLIDTMGDTFGLSGDVMGTMLMVMGAIFAAIGVGWLTRNPGFATGATIPVLLYGNYLGLIPLAATMTVGGLTVMFVLWHIWIRGT